MAQKPIEVFFWNTPNGRKVVIALEEMGLPYFITPVNIMTGDQFKPEFLKISPNNRMPAIIDPSGPGNKPISVFESGAILQYLGRKTGKFYGKSERQRVEVDQWIHWQMAGLGPNAGQANHFKNYAPTIEPDLSKLKYGADRYVNELSRLLGVLERRLSDRDYAAGQYSLADMMIWPWLGAAPRVGLDMKSFPRLQSYSGRIEARSAVKRALAVGAELVSNVTANTKEAEQARKIMFGQTAESIAKAAALAAKSGDKPAKALKKNATKASKPSSGPKRGSRRAK